MEKPEKSFYELIPIRGFPTKFSRWCCDELKKKPTKEVSLERRLMGIRKEESAKRANRPRIDRYFKKQTLYKPIFNWGEWAIWEYIEKYNLPYCELYDQGFDRVGCVVCPFICGRPKVIKKHMDRWPGIYRAFERAMLELWNGKLKGRAIENTFEEFLQNWYDAKGVYNTKEGFDIIGGVESKHWGK